MKRDLPSAAKAICPPACPPLPLGIWRHSTWKSSSLNILPMCTCGRHRIKQFPLSILGVAFANAAVALTHEFAVLGKHMQHLRTAKLAFFAVLLICGKAALADYMLTTIDVPGASNTFLTGINDSGQIVGYY